MNYVRKIPTLIQIHNQFMKSGIIGVLYTFLLLPMRFSLNSLKNDEDTEAEEKLKYLLNYFDRKGFLD